MFARLEATSQNSLAVSSQLGHFFNSNFVDFKEKNSKNLSKRPFCSLFLVRDQPPLCSVPGENIIKRKNT
jgi:hypothetical protein